MSAAAPGKGGADPGWRAGQDTRQMRHLSQSAILEEVGPPRLVRVLLFLLSLSVFGFIGWAAVTELKETTKASGEVVPTGSVLAIQHLEGGIIQQIFVKEGDIVNAGDTLVRMNPTAARAQLEETEARAASLEIRRERLLAFAEGRAPDSKRRPGKGGRNSMFWTARSASCPTGYGYWARKRKCANDWRRKAWYRSSFFFRRWNSIRRPSASLLKFAARSSARKARSTRRGAR